MEDKNSTFDHILRKIETRLMPDYDYWKKMDYWTLNEACFLLMEINPDDRKHIIYPNRNFFESIIIPGITLSEDKFNKLTLDDVEPCEEPKYASLLDEWISEKNQEYLKIRDLALRSYVADDERMKGYFPDDTYLATQNKPLGLYANQITMLPPDFLNWASEKGYAIPEPFLEITSTEKQPTSKQETSIVSPHPNDDKREQFPDEKAAEEKEQISDTTPSFIRKGEYWEVSHGGKTEMVRNLDGINYIVTLLEKPGTSVTCRELHHILHGNVPDRDMSIGEAMERGLAGEGELKVVNDPDTGRNYWKRYQELQRTSANAGDDPEGAVIKSESEKEMQSLLEALNQRSFADPDAKKAQTNITRRLETAYKAITKVSMKKTGKHLRNYIRPDGAYGLIYNGDLTWKIIR